MQNRISLSSPLTRPHFLCPPFSLPALSLASTSTNGRWQSSVATARQRNPSLPHVCSAPRPPSPLLHVPVERCSRAASFASYRCHGRLSEQSSLATIVLPLGAPKPAPPPPPCVRLNPYHLSPASRAAGKAVAAVQSSAAATVLVVGPTRAASGRAELSPGCARPC